jgi:hypothetical protein
MYSKIHKTLKHTSGIGHTETANPLTQPKSVIQPQLEPGAEQKEVISKAEVEKIKASGSN